MFTPLSRGETAPFALHCAGSRPGGRVTFSAGPEKVTKKEALNTSHLVITLRLEANGKGSGTRTPAEDPTGSRRGDTACLNLSEETEAVVRRMFSCQSR